MSDPQSLAANVRDYPRFFRHTTQPASDALFARFDGPEVDCVVITSSGDERPPNHSPWTVRHCVLAAQLGMAEEIDAATAESLQRHAKEATCIATAESQLSNISGALADAGNVVIREDNYAESVRELTRQRDWYGLLARVANMESRCEWGPGWLHVNHPDWQKWKIFEPVEMDEHGLPVEREDYRAALEAAMKESQ